MMPEPLALAIDQGTHASRAMLVDQKGRIRYSSYVNVSLFSSPSRVEQDPSEILSSVQTVVQRAVRASRDIGPLVCSGLATQRSSILVWDRHTGKSLAPLISWQDCRGEQWLKQWAPQAEMIKERTGLPLSAHYSVSKLKWLIKNVSAVKDAYHDGRLAWGPVSSFLLFHLLKESPWIVDHANAQRTQLFNLHTLVWDTSLFRQFGVPVDQVPKTVPTCHRYGILKACDVPMWAVTGDQQAAFFSLGASRHRTAIVNLGTGAFLLLGSGNRLVQHPGLLSGVLKTSDQHKEFVLEGTVNGAGAALDWASEKWRISNAADQLPTWLAYSDEPPIFINTVGGLGSPWWRPNMVPRLIGEGTAAQKMVAVAESILFLIQANLDVMEGLGIAIQRLQVTGGLARLDGLCQRLADLAHKEVYRPAETEATARGVAWLAFQCPDRWPKPGRGRVFKPKKNDSLNVRYQKFCDHIDKL